MQGVFVVDKNELAREAAADLAAQFGPGIVTRTEQAIRDELPPAAEGSRSWGDVLEGIHLTGDVVHVVDFLMILAPIAAAKWPQLKNVAALRAVLRESAKESTRLKPDIAHKVIDAVLRRVRAKG
jgi:hypothetical protein